MNASLYAKIYGWDNLLLDYRKAGKGKRGKEPAARFEYHLEDNPVTLQEEPGSKLSPCLGLAPGLGRAPAT